MYTTCPRCETQLTVTVAGLRSGQGFVRCSRCGDVFNALLELAEDGESPQDTASATVSRPALKIPDPAMSPAPAKREELAESELVSTGTFHTIVLEGDAVLQTEEVVPETELDAQIKAIAGHVESTPEPDTVETPTFDLDERELDRLELEHATAPRGTDTLPQAMNSAEKPPPPAGGAPTPAAAPAPSTLNAESLLGKADAARADASSQSGRYLIIGIVLLVGVAAALVHVYRHELVEQAWAARPLTALYAALHLPLRPVWDVSAYEARQLGAEALDGNPPRITVRASIHNRAAHAQPAPLLRVALQDRFGLQLTTRVVAPEEYLRDSSSAELGPDQRRDVSFTLPDAGLGAVGFEIDACLRDPDGELRCSSDAQPAH
jgi:predicted Zn finger-like uncharacterized protein